MTVSQMVVEQQEKPIRRISGSKVIYWVNEALSTISDPVYMRFQSQVIRVQVQNVYLVLKANNALSDNDKMEQEYHEAIRQLLRIEILDLLTKLRWTIQCQHRESARVLFQKLLILRDIIESHVKAIQQSALPLERDIINAFGLSFLHCINKSPQSHVLVKDPERIEVIMTQAHRQFATLCLGTDGYVSPGVQYRIHAFVTNLHFCLHSYALSNQQKTY
ncbi:hypothetical protein TRICI_003402 [Trichomonascus ciferrii]|uniref:Uncharacterized protein n=1 Tax=Trichomonascus ciferrii TaxID=44093 RepID=A0A642V3B4_9ASCO|nr:hypothetical protein TRICI_003402 [Trichomonascus ciferrii]